MTAALCIAQKSTRLSVAASLSRETRDGVLYASVVGLVMATDIAAIRAQIASAITGAPVVCIDYSRAVLAITSSGLDALFLAAPPGPSALVMAWVVPDVETAALWRQQATRFALAGVRRFATHRIEEAQQWVCDQARRAALRQVLR